MAFIDVLKDKSESKQENDCTAGDGRQTYL